MRSSIQDSANTGAKLALVRLTTLACLAAAVCGLLLARAGTAQAAGTVGNGTPGSCTDAALNSAMTGGSGLIIFSCGPNPVVITITDNGGLNVFNGFYYTIDGGNEVTLSGAGANRLFDVRVGGALTLTDIILTDGYQDGIHGNLPEAGGAILDEGLSLTLEHVTIRNSQSTQSGGGIEIITGTVSVQDSLIEGNQSGLGGGIDNAGPLSLISTLSLINTTVRSNHALTDSGGGLNLGGAVIIINNSRIANNHAAGDGGGAILHYGTATLNNSTLSGNSAEHGSGFLNDGVATLNNSTLSGNLAGGNGGGIFNEGTLTLNSSTLSGSSAYDGGGIWNHGSATLNNSTLSGNSVATGDGGGIFNLGTLTLNSSTLNGNSAGLRGGGIWTNDGSVTLNNSTLSGNSAVGGDGGAIFNGAPLTLTNSTLSGNNAGGSGGGISNYGSASLWNVTVSNNSAASGGALFMANATTTVLSNSILAYSTAGGNCFGTITALEFTFSSDNSCALPIANTINGQNPNNLDPLLTALGNYGGPTQVHMLKPGSPAIAGIVGTDTPATDQRGQPRPGFDGNRDIGAVERGQDESTLAPRLYLPLIER